MFKNFFKPNLSRFIVPNLLVYHFSTNWNEIWNFWPSPGEKSKNRIWSIPRNHTPPKPICQISNSQSKRYPTYRSDLCLLWILCLTNSQGKAFGPGGGLVSGGMVFGADLGILRFLGSVIIKNNTFWDTYGTLIDKPLAMNLFRGFSAVFLSRAPTTPLPSSSWGQDLAEKQEKTLFLD